MGNILIGFTQRFNTIKVSSSSACHIAFLFTLVLLLLCLAPPSFAEKRDLEIAVAASFPGTGQNVMNAVEILFEEINEQGGIEGRKLVLKKFDDQEKPDVAVQNAQELVKGNSLAVIGHLTSSLSIAAGKVYRAHGILAISPKATSLKVTQENDWYFRTIYNDKIPALFSAYYVQDVFQEDTVTMISHQESFGTFIGEEFLKNAQRLGLDVAYQHTFQNDQPDLLQNYDRIVEDLLQLPKRGVIFLGTNESEAAQLIIRMRNAGIQNIVMGGDTLVGQSFVQKIQEIAPNRVGFYTKHVYGAAPFNYDSANQQAQRFREQYRKKYKQEPQWETAYAYDAAKVIVESIRLSGIAKSENEDIAVTRRLLKDTISSFNSPSTAVPGLTGLNYFDAFGDPTKPVSIGFYQGPYFVASLTQFQLIAHPEEVLNLEKKIENSQIVEIDDLYFFETKVVYSGIQLKKIRDIDYSHRTFHADFLMWFRAREKLEPTDIVFPDAIEPVTLEPIQEETMGLTRYQLFRVSGIFQGEQNNPDRLGRFSLKLRFRHARFPRHQLLFIPDSLGMGLKQPQLLLEQIQETEVLEPQTKQIVDYLNTHENSTAESALGSILATSETIEYSTFNLSFRLRKTGIGFIFDNQWYLLGFYLGLNFIVSFLGVFLLFQLFLVLTKKTKTDFDDELVALLKAPAYGLVFLVGLTFIHQDMRHFLSEAKDQLIANILELLIFTTIFIGVLYRSSDLLTEYFVKLADKTETKFDDLVTPYIGKTLQALSIIFLGMKAGGIFFNLSAISFLSILGAFGLAAGLLFKDLFAEVFACVQIFLDDPFKEGDDVIIGNGPKGSVEKIGLRSTLLRYKSGQLVQMPNTIVAGSKIENFSRAQELGTSYKLKINGISSTVLQTLIDEIRKILEQTEGVHSTFRHVSFAGFEGNGRVIQIIVRSSADWEETQYVLENVNLQILQLLESHHIDRMDYEFLYLEQTSSGNLDTPPMEPKTA